MPFDTIKSPIVSSLADDPDLVDLVEMFVDQLPERLSAMHRAFEQSDLRRLRQLAHQLKGSGGSYGFAVLTFAAAELEEGCKAQALDRIGDALRELSDLVPRLKARPDASEKPGGA